MNCIFQLYGIFFGFFGLFFSHAQAQWKVDNSLSIAQISAVSMDRKENLYVGTKNGSLYKIENQKISKEFSAESGMSMDQLDAWQGLRILAFNENFQQIKIFDRFIARFDEINLNRLPFHAGYISAVALGSGGELLLYDQNEHRILRMQNTSMQLMAEINLQSIPDLRDLNVKQVLAVGKRILVLCESQLVLFDNLGSFEKMIEIPDSYQMSFWNERIYMVSANEVYELDLNSQSIRAIELNFEKKINGVCRAANAIIVWNEAEIFFLKKT